MPRMPKKRKLELSFFLNERGRVRPVTEADKLDLRTVSF